MKLVGDRWAPLQISSSLSSWSARQSIAVHNSKRETLTKTGLNWLSRDLKTGRKIDNVNICKADAIAQLSKWYNAATKVRAMYRSVTGNIVVVGRMSELSSSTVKIQGDACEMVLYLRDTSQYGYNDAHQSFDGGDQLQTNRYPIFIDVKFSSGDRLEVSEFLSNSDGVSAH